MFENKLIISPFQKVEIKAEKSHFVLQSVNLFSNKALQPMHLIIVLAIVLLLFGPKKLPELSKGLGQAIRGFKQALHEEHYEGQDSGEKNLSSKRIQRLIVLRRQIIRLRIYSVLRPDAP